MQCTIYVIIVTIYYIYIYIYYNPACMIEVYTFINVSKFIPLHSFLDRFVDLFFVVTKLMPVY